MEPKTDIWQAQAALGRRLLVWSGLSVGAGTALALVGHPVWKGLGTQCAGWGAIDAIIGGLGLRQATRKAADPANHEPEAQARARQTLRRVLWINTGLDVAYVTGGVVLAATKGREGRTDRARLRRGSARLRRGSTRFWRGSGWGIVVQGGFLFLFDLIHALTLS